jgi:uncharacterized repeat protein (TIGR01451 family)
MMARTRILGTITLGVWLLAGTWTIGRAQTHPVPLWPQTMPQVPLQPAPPPVCGLAVHPPAAPAMALPLPAPPDPPVPVVTIQVRVPASAPPGQEIEYRLCIENCSPADAHHVVIRNPLPANARFVRASPEPSQLAPELQWKLGTMHGGERRQIVLVLQPTGPSDLTNCARVQFEHGQCVTTRIAALPPAVFPPEGPEPGKLPSAVPVPPEGGKLKLTMTGPKQQYANLPATYFLTVTNTGKIPATNLLLTAQLPAQMQFVSASAGGKFVENEVAWILGNLEPGAMRTVELVLRAQATGRLCVKGRALADRGLTDEAEICTVFQGASALLLELTDRKDPVAVGEEASYLIEVVNQGSAPATNVQVRALVPEAMSYTRARGANVKVGERTPDGYQTLLFEPVAALAPGARVEIEVFAKALRPGDARFKVLLSADQLERGPVLEEESTQLFAEDGPRKE